MLKRKKIKPITLKDVTIIDDGKLKKAITAASWATRWSGSISASMALWPTP